MIAYPGTNPVTVFPGTPTAGYGLWPTPVEAQGGNQRSAANLMAMGESLTDRTNFIGWRLINIVDGGTYTFTTTVSTKNAWQFRGSATFTGTGSQMFLTADTMMVAAGKTLNIGDPGLFSLGNMDIWDDCLVRVLGSSGHPGILSAENHGLIKIKSGGELTLDSGAIWISLADLQISGAYLPSGAGAFKRLRAVHALPDGDDTIDGESYDVYRVPVTLTVNRTYTLGTPGGPVEILVTRIGGGGSEHDAIFTDGSVTWTLPGTMSSGLRASMRFLWDGTHWYRTANEQ